MSKLERLEKAVEKFETLLNQRLRINISMSKNDGSFGISYYLYLNLNDKFVDPIKIRLSDHSVSSVQRTLNEVHVPQDEKGMIESIDYIERLFFPERYEEKTITVKKKQIEWSEKLINDYSGEYEIIGQRVTKKGSIQLILEVPVLKTIFIKK